MTSNENKSNNDRRARIRTLILMGILAALCIVIGKFIYIPIGINSKYSISFAVIALSGVLLGGVRGAVIAAVADVLGAIVQYGNICPLVTVCVFLSGLTFGLLLCKKRSILRIIIAVLIDQIICDLFLKSAALAIWYNGGISAYPAVFATRIIQAAIMTPVELIILLLLNRFFFDTAIRLTEGFLNK